MQRKTKLFASLVPFEFHENEIKRGKDKEKGREGERERAHLNLPIAVNENGLSLN